MYKSGLEKLNRSLFNVMPSFSKTQLQLFIVVVTIASVSLGCGLFKAEPSTAPQSATIRKTFSRQADQSHKGLVIREDFVRRIDNIGTMTPQEKQSLETDLTDHLSNIDDALSRVVNNTSQPKAARLRAMRLLGIFGWLGSAEVLSKQLTLSYTDNIGKDAVAKQKSTNSLYLQETYSAVHALINLGDDSLPYMIENLRQSDNSVERALSLSVIRSIDGLYIAKFRLERAVKNESNKANRERLQKAIAELPKAKLYFWPGDSRIKNLDDPDKNTYKQ